MTRGHRSPRRAALLLFFAVAACQTTDPMSAGSGLGDGPGTSFRERRGWEVELVTAANGAPPHCRGRRSAGADSAAIVFIAGERESGFRLTGLSPVPAPAAASPGEITAAFDNGDRRTFAVQRDGADGRTLLAVFPTTEYEDSLHPFGRAKSVTLSSPNGENLGVLALNGSAWAINATDECRRMRIPPAKPR